MFIKVDAVEAIKNRLFKEKYVKEYVKYEQKTIKYVGIFINNYSEKIYKNKCILLQNTLSRKYLLKKLSIIKTNTRYIKQCHDNIKSMHYNIICVAHTLKKCYENTSSTYHQPYDKNHVPLWHF